MMHALWYTGVFVYQDEMNFEKCGRITTYLSFHVLNKDVDDGGAYEP